MRPPNKSNYGSNDQGKNSNQIDINYLKEYGKDAIQIREEDMKLWTLVTTFPNISYKYKLIILIINIIAPGKLKKEREHYFYLFFIKIIAQRLNFQLEFFSLLLGHF